MASFHFDVRGETGRARRGVPFALRHEFHCGRSDCLPSVQPTERFQQSLLASSRQPPPSIQSKGSLDVIKPIVRSLSAIGWIVHKQPFSFRCHILNLNPQHSLYTSSSISVSPRSSTDIGSSAPFANNMLPRLPRAVTRLVLLFLLATPVLAASNPLANTGVTNQPPTPVLNSPKPLLETHGTSTIHQNRNVTEERLLVVLMSRRFRRLSYPFTFPQLRSNHTRFSRCSRWESELAGGLVQDWF